MANRDTKPPEGPRRKLSDQVFEYILGQVIAGAFAVNSRLPTEAELAERLRVSRPVVREALRRLRDDGLIASRQGSGSVVIRRPDGAMPTFAPVESIADIQRCFVFRKAVEGEAAALAAHHRSAGVVERLRLALDKLEAAIEQRHVGTDEDFAFHFAVADATGNHFFTSTLLAIRDQIATGIRVNRSLSLIQPQPRILAVQQEHRAIFDAICAGSEDAARRAMRAHIENARLRIFEGA